MRSSPEVGTISGTESAILILPCLNLPERQLFEDRGLTAILSEGGGEVCHRYRRRSFRPGRGCLARCKGLVVESRPGVSLGRVEAAEDLTHSPGRADIKERTKQRTGQPVISV